MVALAFTASILCILAAEFIHFLRCRRNARLAFPDVRRGLLWVALAGGARILFAAAVLWGLALLWDAVPGGRSLAGGQPRDEEKSRLVVILDASTSMNISDSGADGGMTRATRARNLIQQIISRNGRMPRTTLLTFAEHTVPVVIDAKNWDVVASVMSKAYYSQAFVSEKTDVHGAVSMAFSITDEFPEKSTTVILVSDGEGSEGEPPADVPPSVRNFIALGVGSLEGRAAGKDLASVSRQDSVALKRIASAVGGVFFDCNRESLPADSMVTLLPPAPADIPPVTNGAGGLLLLGLGAIGLCAVPLVLSAMRRTLTYS